MDKDVAAVFQAEARTAHCRADNRFAAGHRLEHLDVRPGGNLQRHGDGCRSGVERANIFHESVDLDALVQSSQIISTELLVLWSGNHPQAHIGPATPHSGHHLTQQLLEPKKVR